jgi:cathepsin B
VKADAPSDTADQAGQAFDHFQAALSVAMVAQINEANASWSAGMNEYFADKSFEFLQASCGTKIDLTKVGTAGTPTDAPTWFIPGTTTEPSDLMAPPTTPTTPSIRSALPAEYDARLTWGAKCPSVHDIRDQSGCGSCWAVAAAESMTDRHCIATDGARQPYISAQNILTCCGHEECGSCQGGYPIFAWKFWVKSGVVTGGAFGSTSTCQPYEWPPCEHHTNGSRPQCVAQDTTPQCTNTCSQGGFDYQGDKSFGKSAFKVAYSEETIMDEIMTHGPVEAGFMVYEDFPHYTSGVYRHVKGNMVGGHAVKLLGWGVENGEKYWLAANSWNTNWGMGGFFKIAKGTNECMIEDMIFAGRV